MSQLPLIDTVDALDIYRRDTSHWRPIVAEVAKSHGIHAESLEDLGGGNLIVGLDDSYVIKLAPLVFAREIHAEAAGLLHAASALPLDTPRFHSGGEIDSWVYVLETRMPGRTLKECWASVDHHDRIALLGRIGEWLAAFHRLGLPQEGVLADSWSDFLTHRIDRCVARQAGWSVPATILEGIPGYLQRANVAAPSSTVLLHADLTDENVLLQQSETTWRVSSIIDFGDARIGAPLYDLITPALLIARGDRELLYALLDGYGVDRSGGAESLKLSLMAYSILHPFNDLTRYTGWTNEPASTIEQLADVMFPL